MTGKSTRSPTFENLAADLDMDDGEARAVFMAGLKARPAFVSAQPGAKGVGGRGAGMADGACPQGTVTAGQYRMPPYG